MYSAALGHLALGGHLRDPSSSSRSGHAFHRVAAFDCIILASRRLGRAPLLACHLISHRCFRYKCTALFSSASLRFLVCNKFALSDGGWSFFSATPANKRVLCYTPRPKLGSGPNERLSRRRQARLVRTLGRSREGGMLFCLLCCLSSRLGFFLSEYWSSAPRRGATHTDVPPALPLQGP